MLKKILKKNPQRSCWGYSHMIDSCHEILFGVLYTRAKLSTKIMWTPIQICPKGLISWGNLEICWRKNTLNPMKWEGCMNFLLRLQSWVLSRRSYDQQRMFLWINAPFAWSKTIHVMARIYLLTHDCFFLFPKLKIVIKDWEKSFYNYWYNFFNTNMFTETYRLQL